jgi:hypothetical protein
MPVRSPGRAWLAGPPVVDDRLVSLSQRRFIMEPHREEPQKAPLAGAERRPKRFRIIKLEERVAPTKGGHKPTSGAAGCTGCCYMTVW